MNRPKHTRMPEDWLDRCEDILMRSSFLAAYRHARGKDHADGFSGNLVPDTFSTNPPHDYAGRGPTSYGRTGLARLGISDMNVGSQPRSK